MHLLLNLNFSSAVLLCEIFPVLTDLGFLDLYGLDLRTLEGLLYSLLGEFGRILDTDSLEPAVLCESICTDLGQHL